MTTTTSASRVPCTAAASDPAGRSWTCRTSRHSPPSAATRAGRAGPRASRTRPGPGGPAWSSSSPVTRTRTRGAGRTVRVSWPQDAASPSNAGQTGVPAGARRLPAGASSPALRMCRPGGGTGPYTRPSSPARAASTGSTAHAPAGTCAPVEISTHSPAASAPAHTVPARTSPRTRHGPGPATAYPSMAAVSNAGRGCGVRRASASVSPTASASGTVRAGHGLGAAWARIRACTQGSSPGRGGPAGARTGAGADTRAGAGTGTGGAVAAAVTGGMGTIVAARRFGPSPEGLPRRTDPLTARGAPW